MRVIDADALSALLFKRMGECEAIANDLPKDSYQGCVYYGKVTALYEVQLAIEREMPTLDYAPIVRGEWIDGYCSACGEEATYTETAEEVFDYDWEENLRYSHTEMHRTYNESPYCPNCGAKNEWRERT